MPFQKVTWESSVMGRREGELGLGHRETERGRTGGIEGGGSSVPSCPPYHVTCGPRLDARCLCCLGLHTAARPFHTPQGSAAIQHVPVSWHPEVTTQNPVGLACEPHAFCFGTPGAV